MESRETHRVENAPSRLLKLMRRLEEQKKVNKSVLQDKLARTAFR